MGWNKRQPAEETGSSREGLLWNRMDDNQRRLAAHLGWLDNPSMPSPREREHH